MYLAYYPSRPFPLDPSTYFLYLNQSSSRALPFNRPSTELFVLHSSPNASVAFFILPVLGQPRIFFSERPRLSLYAASGLCLAGYLRTFHTRRYDAVEGPRNMRASAVRTEGPKKQFRRPQNTQVSTIATEIMLRRSLRLQRLNVALPRTTTHGNIKPVNPVYASKHGGDLDPVYASKHGGDLDPVPGKHQADGVNYPRRKHTINDLDLDFDMADVRSIGYRINCLRPNGIHFHLPSDTLPHVVALLTNQILTVAPHPPAMLVAMMDELERLSTYGGYELSVRNCFSRGLFPAALRPELCTQFEPFLPLHLIPTHPNASYALPQPRPDLLYGYSI